MLSKESSTDKLEALLLVEKKERNPCWLTIILKCLLAEMDFTPAAKLLNK